MATSSKTPLLHIVTPVYNEADNFETFYNAIKEKVRTPHEIVVVYDFDEDSTVPVVKEIQKKSDDKQLILHKNMRGRGVLNALQAGFDYVKSGPILITMADLSDDMGDVDKMYAHFLAGADIVCGSRYMRGGKQIGGPLIKRILSRLAGTSLWHFRRFPTHDVTNNFKLYNKKVIDAISIDSTAGFEIAMEITVKAHQRGFKIEEIPTTWRDRTAGESNFKLWKWLPSYLTWYFYAFRGSFSR